MNYSGYNYQQQQQHSYGYDPSQIQIQPYDQSYAYQQYYAYNAHAQYAYFPNTHQSQFHFQTESTPLHPPGVNPIASEPATTGPSQYRGRGGRGGRPFRGGGRGRGHFNHEGPASYHGRGRGVGGSRHLPSHSSGPAISNLPGAPAAAVATSSSVSAPTPLLKPSQVPAAALQSPLPPRRYCCEICKVECNTPEILEQHKNGKKHTKNMRVHEQLQRRNALNGQQSGQIPTSQLNLTDPPKKVQESEKKGCPTENMGSGVVGDNHKEEIQLSNNVGKISEVPAEMPEGKTTDTSAARGRGLKRKKKGGKGGKYMRTNDGSRPLELSKAVQTVSFRCDLCNVKCESQVVYQSHVTGKKHLSRLKRAHDHQALAGVDQQVLSGGLQGLQALYPPDINALSNAINAQVQQGDNDPQLLLAQLLMTVLSQAQVPATTPGTGPMAAQIPAPTSVAGPSYEPQLLQTQVSGIAAHVEMEKPTGETKSELLPVPLGLNTKPGSIVSTQIEGGSSETEQQVLKHPRDSSGVTPADNSGSANDKIPSSKCEALTF